MEGEEVEEDEASKNVSSASGRVEEVREKEDIELAASKEMEEVV